MYCIPNVNTGGLAIDSIKWKLLNNRRDIMEYTLKSMNSNQWRLKVAQSLN